MEISKIHPAWTLTYIDSLSYAQVLRIFGFEQAIQMIRDDNKKE